MKHTNPLGKKIDSPKSYDPGQLFPIKRKAVKNSYGQDLWTLYEVYWLDSNHTPHVRIGHLSYDANSPNIIESKSLKLYLNSLNNTVFATTNDLKKTIINDLETCLKTKVTLTLYTIEEFSQHLNTPQESTELSYSNTLELTKKDITETVHTHTYRSYCPVTSQPDFATLIITYTGKRISHKQLLQTLHDKSNKQAFHEECIDNIFVTLLNQYACNQLCIYGLFTRRGGIAITPIRSTHNQLKNNFQIARQ